MRACVRLYHDEVLTESLVTGRRMPLALIGACVLSQFAWSDAVTSGSAISDEVIHVPVSASGASAVEHGQLSEHRKVLATQPLTIQPLPATTGKRPPVVQRIAVHPTGLPLLVVDNFLEPSVAEAAEEMAKNGSDSLLAGSPWERSSWFPGLRRPLPPAYEEMVTSALGRLSLNESLGAVVSSEARPSHSSMLTVTCTAPANLTLFNRAPHHDEETTIAVVHYLSRSWRASPAGGTGYYRERSSGQSRFSVADCEAMAAAWPHNASTFCVDSLLDKCFRLLTEGTNAGLQDRLERFVADSDLPGLQIPRSRAEQRRICSEHVGLSSMMREAGARPKYMAGSDELFELLHEVPYEFNRAVIYDGAMLHAAHVPPEALIGDEAQDCDPAVGRLAASLFLRRVTERTEE